MFPSSAEHVPSPESLYSARPAAQYTLHPALETANSSVVYDWVCCKVQVHDEVGELEERSDTAPASCREARTGTLQVEGEGEEETAWK